jgi:adenine-specific DNA-methyltransferase
MLIEGFPLDSTVTAQPHFTANRVYTVASDFHAHRLWLSLDNHVTDTTIDQITAVLGENDVFVCLDSALSDQSKVRLNDRATVKTI